MTKAEMTQRLGESEAWVTGRRIKIDLGDEGILFLDGIARKVSEADAPADTIISLSWADLEALERRELDPMTALMQGRLRIDGDMSDAMHLQAVIAQIRS